MDLLAVPFLSRKLSSGIDTRRDRGGVEDPAEHEDAYLLSQEDKEFMAKMKHEASDFEQLVSGSASPRASLNKRRNPSSDFLSLHDPFNKY